jgi:hypothetical protein
MKLFFAFCLLLVGVGVLGQADTSTLHNPTIIVNDSGSTRVQMVTTANDTLLLVACSMLIGDYPELNDRNANKLADYYGNKGILVNLPNLSFVAYKGGKYGLSDWKGELLTPYIYDTIYRFDDNGIALVRQNGKVGLLHKSGKLWAQAVFDYVGLGINNVYRAATKQRFTAIVVGKDGKYGVIDTLEQVLVPLWYNNIWRAVDADSVKQSSFGVQFPDTDFWIKLPEKYSNVTNNMAYNRQPVMMNDKFGCVDKHDNLVIPLIYDCIWTFYNGLAVAQVGNKVGIIDTLGNAVVPIVYNAITQFNKGVLIALTDKGTFILLNNKSEIVTQNVYRFENLPWYLPVYLKIPYIDPRIWCGTGLVRPTKFEAPVPNGLVFEKGQMVAYKQDSTQLVNGQAAVKVVYLDTLGKEIDVDPLSELLDFKNGLAINSKDGLDGLVNEKGQWAVPAKYGDIQPYNQFGWYYCFTTDRQYEHLYATTTEYQAFGEDKLKYWFVDDANPTLKSNHTLILNELNRYSMVDLDKKVLVPSIYDTCVVVDKTIFFRKDHKWGVWDSKGKNILPCVYDELKRFPEGEPISLVMVKQNNKWAIFNLKQAKFISKFVYDDIIKQYGSHSIILSLAKKDGLYGACDISGKEVIPIIYKVAASTVYSTIYRNGVNCFAFVKDDKVLLFDAKTGAFVKTWLYLPKNTLIIEQKGTNADEKSYQLQNTNGTELSSVYDDMRWQGDEQGTFIWAFKSKGETLLSSTGKELLPLGVFGFYSYGDGLVQVDSLSKRGLVNVFGKVVVHCKYQSIDVENYAGLYRAQKNDTALWVDRYGNEYSCAKYGVDRFGLSSKYTAVYYPRDSVCVVDKANKVVSLMNGYANYKQLKNKPYFLVSKNGYWGMIDSSLQVVVPTIYTQIEEAENGLLKVALKNKWGYINLQNRVIIPITYQGFNTNNGTLFETQLNNYWGVVDTNGKVIVPFEYNSTSIELYNYDTPNLTRINVFKNGKYGYIDVNNGVALPCIWRNAWGMQ